MLLGTRLYMKKSGQFGMTAIGDDSTQCGVLHSRTFQYHVVIEGDCARLTPEGFIIDNNDIQRYFDDTYRVVGGKVPSCEQIAMRAVQDFAAMIPGCKAVDVTVDGTGQTGLTAAWRADNQDTAVLGAA